MSAYELIESGPVRFYRMTSGVAGRAIVRVGVYVVDGLLIDTGPSRCRTAVREILRRESIDQIVLTHHHEDHTGNAAIAAAATGATPRIHPQGLALVRDPAPLPFYRRVVWGAPDAVDADPLGTELETASHRFDLVHTPGHAPDHVVLHEPRQDWLFSGDMFLTDRPEKAFAYEDLGTLIASLRRLLAVPDCQLFCQHTGFHPSHQNRLGRRLDALLGMRDRAVVHHEEGRSVKEIARQLGLRDGLVGWFSGGELSASNLVAALLRDAGKLRD